MIEELKIGKFSLSQINAFLKHPHLARLATAVPVRDDPNFFQPHNVPVWYWWDGTALWISAFQSTRKVKEVKRNPYIAVLVDVAQAVDGITAVLMEGKSEWIVESSVVQEMSRIIYTHYMGEEGVKAAAPQSWIVDPENSIIQLIPKKMYAW